MRAELLRFTGAVERDPANDAWIKEHSGELGAIAHQWFEVMQKCGDELRQQRKLPACRLQYHCLRVLQRL